MLTCSETHERNILEALETIYFFVRGRSSSLVELSTFSDVASRSLAASEVSKVGQDFPMLIPNLNLVAIQSDSEPKQCCFVFVH